MSGSDITINSNDGGQFSGYLALPEGGSGPGVVVIQEIFGVNDVMRRITDEWAANGYVALCPDIFWRQEPGIQLTDQTEEDWARAFELFNGFDLDLGSMICRPLLKCCAGCQNARARWAQSGSAWVDVWHS